MDGNGGYERQLRAHEPLLPALDHVISLAHLAIKNQLWHQKCHASRLLLLCQDTVIERQKAKGCVDGPNSGPVSQRSTVCTSQT